MFSQETLHEQARIGSTTPLKRCRSWLALLLAWALLPAPLPAAIVQTGSVSPNVSTWTGSTVGQIGTTSAGSVTVDAGSLLTSQSGILGASAGATGMATVTGAGSKWTSSALYVGRSSAGTLTIEAGGQVGSQYGYLGLDGGSTGMASVIGAGSKWTIGIGLYVGSGGAGALTVSDGGEVVAGTLFASLSDLYGDGTITTFAGAVLDANLVFNAANGTSQSFAFGSGGTLNVAANGYSLGAGYKQSGSLIISEGISVSSYWGYLGYFSGSTGTATVTGAGSKWTNNDALYVGGRSGAGSLTVSDRGEVVARTLLASLSDLHGDGTITATAGVVLDADIVFDAENGTSQSFAFGSGGTLNVTVSGGDLGVGYKRSGSLIISEGVGVSSNSGILGYLSGSTGTATVTGAGSKWTNTGRSPLYVGRSGAGSLAIESGGEVSSQGGYLSYYSGSSGTATVTGAGSKWTSGGYLYVGHQSSAGSLAIEMGGEVGNQHGYIGYSSGSTGTATVTGAGSKWTNNGALYIGYFGTGTLTIEAGGLVSVQGTLSIGQSSDFLNMATGGMLALHGEAAGSLSQFLGLVSGNDDAIRFWDNSLAAWSPLASATFGVDYTLEYLATGDLAGYTLLTVGAASSPGLAGDFNADGSVDGADFLAWQRGESPDPLGGDSLTAWKTNFGTSPPGPASSLAVPEPTAGALALLLPLAGRLCQAASNRRRRTTAL